MGEWSDADLPDSAAVDPEAMAAVAVHIRRVAVMAMAWFTVLALVLAAVVRLQAKPMMGPELALFAVVILPGFLAGWKLLRYQAWARGVMIITGTLSMLSFPLGTAFGAYTLWVLLKPEAVALFKRPAPA